MKLRELLDITYDETWLKVVDNETNGDSEELFVWAADWVGGDRATLERVRPLLDREVEDVTSCLGDTPESDDHNTSVIVVNLVARQSAKMKFRVTVARRLTATLEVEADSDHNAEMLALEKAKSVEPKDADTDSGWCMVDHTVIVTREETT